MNRYRLLAATLAAVMVLSAMAPLGTAAAATDDDSYDELSVEFVEERVVEVTVNESPVENATVEVTVTDKETESYEYLDAGEHANATDDDGMFELAEPEEDITVNVIATVGDEEATDGATLEASEDESAGINVTEDDGEYAVSVTDADGDGVDNATVTVEPVDENATYADNGTHTTDENGTLTLEAPTGNESVEVLFEAEVDNETVETTATLEPADADDDEAEDGDSAGFGSIVSQFVEANQNDTDGPFGLSVAEFVLGNNPGNAPDHAGPPGDDDGEQGPPGEDDEQGPPGEDDEQGPPGEDGDDDTDAEGDEAENGDNDTENGGGPPAHAGPSN